MSQFRGHFTVWRISSKLYVHSSAYLSATILEWSASAIHMQARENEQGVFRGTVRVYTMH